MSNKQQSGTPFLYDETTGDIVGIKLADGSEKLFVFTTGAQTLATINATTVNATTVNATTANATNIDAGASGTAGTVDIFPTTALKGKTQITATANAGNTTTAITTAEQAAARTYTIPDAGASASFVMTEGAQTLNGVKTVPALVTTNIDVGASGTAGTVDVFPATLSKGKAQYAVADQTGDTTVTHQTAGMGQATVITTPDPGAAAASVVLTEGTQTINGVKSFSGNVTMAAATKTLVLKQGADGKAGTFTLNGATPVSVANSSVTANSVIVFTLKTASGTVSVSHPNVVTITAGVGFDVVGLTLDASVYNYVILESAA